MSKRYQAGILTASYNGLKVPNAPTIGTATAGAGSASVTFTAPSDVGGGAITSYTVISSPGSITGTGSSSPVTVSGLTNGTAYTFTVVATNAYGTGPASAASNSVTPSLNYIEDVFSTYLYTGNDSTQTITNGIDLSGKGGLVWGKARSSGAYYPYLSDTVRGLNNQLYSNTTDAQNDVGAYLTATSTGYTINNGGGTWNNNGTTYVNWTFRKQAKFFDVVTYTGNGTSGRAIPHSLGSTPGCIIVKCTTNTYDWMVYHRSLPSSSYFLKLNTTAAQANVSSIWSTTAPTATDFYVGSDGSTNGSGETYVAYLFAHDAGGFGLTGSDNVISCGSYTGNGSSTGPSITLGYEPQWVMAKAASTTGDWFMVDTMRGQGVSGSTSQQLKANTSGAEAASNFIAINSTGFQLTAAVADKNGSGQTYIYIAIRRGPMKVPTSGTSVYNSAAGAAGGITTGIVTDMGFIGQRSGTDKYYWGSRLTSYFYLNSVNTNAQDGSQVGALTWDRMNGFWNNDLTTYQGWGFQRAPSFFDVVCYTGNNVNSRVLTHNLGVAPELVIIKSRTAAFFSGWSVTTSALPVVGGLYQEALLNATGGFNGGGFRVNIPSTGLTATTVTLGTDYSYGNESPNTYVMYLFASCPGVSKVGSYTGTGTTLQVNCSFTGGARFVLIKRTDSTGDWYVWDSARGIVAGNDPYLLLNSTAAEVTNTDYVDTYSAGFEISSTAPAAINANGGTYIYLAIA